MDPLSLLHEVFVWIAPTRWSALTLVVIALLPFALAWFAYVAVDLVSRHEFFQVPLVYSLASVVGLCSGLALIHVRAGTGREATLASLLRAGGPWDISAAEFLSDLVNPFGYDPVRVVEEFMAPGHGDALRVIVIIGMIAAAALVVFTILLWWSLFALRALVAAAIVVLWTMMLTIYIVSLAYWSVAQLNFWIIAIILVVFQFHRNHPRRA